VLIDPDYLDAMERYKEAEELLERAIEAMTTQEKERFIGEHANMIAESALLYNKSLQAAQDHIMAYHSKVRPGIDDRLNEAVCSGLLEELLEESLKKTSCNLRDALAHFYNRCQGLDEDPEPLSGRNVLFVNHVFWEFTGKASLTAMKRFDLDKCNTNSGLDFGVGWKHALGRAGSLYISLLKLEFGGYRKAKYRADPLLFMALIRQESNFDPRAVSSVGAVGLTQIMPQTAKALGMKNIFLPPYFDEARFLVLRERKLRSRAMGLIPKVTEENRLEISRRARATMQKALGLRRKYIGLYSRYKQELLREGTDDRLDPQKSIKYGLKCFATMMRKQEGDISLALASYNAGPHRIKQYKGIPPFPETVSHRNGVVKHYKNYLRKLNNSRTGPVEY
jgi:soluble lytic murein transglycosylase-like protein